MAVRLIGRSGVVSKTFKGGWRNDAELFVKRISWVTGASELTNHFSQFGKVRNITLQFDLRTGLHKGFAFISFENNDFYENIKKFEGKHVIDDEEVVCSLASERKTLLLADADSALFASENSSQMDISKADPYNEAGTVKIICAEESVKEKPMRRGTSSETIFANSMSFQDSKKWTKRTNLLQKLQKVGDPKWGSRKNGVLERTVNMKLMGLVEESEGGNEMYKKTYSNVHSSDGLHVSVTRNGFSGRISSPNSFRVSIVETTNQKSLKK
uniref:RRM domain-containing protein n=1 Tax=Loa loa TaxID=7209 RepID=A0A1I7VGH2_LOALO